MPEQTFIYVVGSSNTDMVVKSQTLPAPGETVMGGEFLMNPGGKGANQAVASARLGGSVYFVGKVGDDLFGKQASEQFEKERVRTNYLLTHPDLPSGIALINVDTNGENTITVAPGANAALTTGDTDVFFPHLKKDDIVLVQLEIPLEVVTHVIHQCTDSGARVILNPAPATKLNEDVLSRLFLITPNETEAELLTGIKITDLPSAELAAQKLEEAGCSNIIITMGSKGAFLHCDTFSGIIPTITVDAVDTTAAGDCFNGALAVALAEGRELPAAVEFACMAAAISTTRLGAQKSLPYRAEVEEFSKKP